MAPSVPDQPLQEPPDNAHAEEMAMIREDYASAMRGNVVDAQTALDEIRARYGL